MKDIRNLIAEATGIPNWLDTKNPSHVEARALAYHVLTHAGWRPTQIARWADRSRATIQHALATHDRSDEAAALYQQHIEENQ